MKKENDNKRKTSDTPIHVQRTKEGTLFEVATAILVVLSWILAFVFYDKLPDTVPTHFNMSGEANGFGSKSIVFVMAGLNTLVAALLLTSAYHPQKLINVPFKTKKNQQYVPLIRMVRCLAVTCAFLFIGIIVRTSGSAIGTYLFIGALLSLFIICIFFNIQSYNLRK